MPTKADRKHLEATVAAFHANYSSSENWGEERWHRSLYPALARPTRYAALVNGFVSYDEVKKVLLEVPSADLQQVELPELPLSARKGEQGKGIPLCDEPRLVLLEHVQPPRSQMEENSTAKDADKTSFLFPPPQQISVPFGLAEQKLGSHWNMDAASALAVHILNVQAGDRVLDLCASPGGKSIALAQLIFPHLSAIATSSSPSSIVTEAQTPQSEPKHREERQEALQNEKERQQKSGCLHSNEIDAGRHKRLLENLHAYLPKPLFSNGSVRALRLDASDPRAFMQLPHGAGGYDKVLVDAPCSSERHVIHAHVRALSGGRIAEEMARWRRGSGGSSDKSRKGGVSNNHSSRSSLPKLQTDILVNALWAVRTGGEVLYSTCSVDNAENDGVVERMLAALAKERKKLRLAWDVEFGLGRESNSGKCGMLDDEILCRMTEETKYGRIALPDIKGAGEWGPLYFCVIRKVAREN